MVITDLLESHILPSDTRPTSISQVKDYQRIVFWHYRCGGTQWTNKIQPLLLQAEVVTRIYQILQRSKLVLNVSKIDKVIHHNINHITIKLLTKITWNIIGHICGCVCRKLTKF